MSDDNKKHPEPELTRKKHVPLKEFGLLKVFEFPDGTVISINTKKGEENCRIYHSSGSYHEFTSDGTSVNFSSNNGVTYGKGGMSVTFDNNTDAKAAGHMRISFDHDAHVEFKKNASLVVGGKTSIASLGELKIAAQGNMYLGTAKGKVVINGGKGVEIKGESGRVMMEAAKGAFYIHAKEGDVHLQAGQDIVQVSDQDNVVQAGGNVTEQAGKNVISLAQSDVGIKGGNNVEVKAGNKAGIDAGSMVDVQGHGDVSGTTVSAPSDPPTIPPFSVPG